MKVAFFSSQAYDQNFFDRENESRSHEIQYFEAHLNELTAPLAKGSEAVCVFVNDSLNAKTLEILYKGGTSVVALRCAGFNNVDLEAAQQFGITVVRVPDYSPHSVAEHAVALILSLNRKIPTAHNRVRDGNFKLNGLMGFDLHGKTVGVVGTGKIGEEFCKIMQGFGCKVIAYDPFKNPNCVELGVVYADLSELFKLSDIISLHCPLTPETHHLINAVSIENLKKT